MPKSINRRNLLKQAAASLVAALAASPVVAKDHPAAKDASREWHCYGSDPGASRYSPLKQINRSNVSKLQVAWVHHTGDASQRPATTIECTPIIVDGVIYLSTCQLQVHALDAATGKLLWSFDPTTVRRRRGAAGVNRAVCYWQQGSERRVFMPVKDMMYCLDAATGKLFPGFGAGGVLDLKENFDCDMTGLSFNLTSPPVAYKDMILVGGGGGEGPEPAAPGHIRAFDARTGKRRWIFHTIPQPGEFGGDTWEGDSWKHAGGTNNWAGMSLDAERGWLFASTGSPSFDFYGGNRKGANLFGNSVIALNADTGERLWHFQTVHHDVLDYDLPAQPALVQARHNGQRIDAVAQVTKTGLLFLFDRKTGKPLFPIEERPVPQSDMPGEATSPTQPFPVKPPPFSRHGFTEDEITNVSPEAHAYVKKIFDQSKTGKIYMPPSKEGTFLLPGLLGGAIWGGCSFDPATNYLFVSSNDVPFIITLIDPPPGKSYRYAHKGNIPLNDAEGLPACKPPWSHLTAIDLNKGEFAWRVVLGEHPALKARGISKSGSPHVGGSIATAGGLVFIAATMDEKMRAFDSQTGETLWEHQLEAGGYATPSTYEFNGRQYVVIAAGGGGQPRTKSSDAIVAFALS